MPTAMAIQSIQANIKRTTLGITFLCSKMRILGALQK